MLTEAFRPSDPHLHVHLIIKICYFIYNNPEKAKNIERCRIFGSFFPIHCHISLFSAKSQKDTTSREDMPCANRSGPAQQSDRGPRSLLKNRWFI